MAVSFQNLMPTRREWRILGRGLLIACLCHVAFAMTRYASLAGFGFDWARATWTDALIQVAPIVWMIFWISGKLREKA